LCYQSLTTFVLAVVWLFVVVLFPLLFHCAAVFELIIVVVILLFLTMKSLHPKENKTKKKIVHAGFV
jgi:hypothetical protein